MGVIEIKNSADSILVTANTGAGQPVFRGRRERAFTRLDLCFAVVSVTVLLGLAVLNLTGERGRTLRCAHNLKKLGQAMEEYAGDHGGGLPPANIQQSQATWDLLIAPYLRPDLGISHLAYARRVLERGDIPDLHCPSDTLVRKAPRTYIMSGHNMWKENFPPGPDNATGVGLEWNEWRVKTMLGERALEQSKTNGDTLDLVKLSWLPDPANTLLLTEVVHPNNAAGRPWMTTVFSARQQVELFKGDRALFHGGRFNYLMADGHVELLSPAATEGAGLHGVGGYTIRPEEIDQILEIGGAGTNNTKATNTLKTIGADIWTIKAGD